MPNLDKDYYLDKSGLSTLVNELETNVVAEEYSSSATYSLGDYCIHDNKFYRCTTAISTAESWTSGHWTQVIIGDELGDKSSIWYGTQAQYDAITNPDPNTTYYITDSSPVSLALGDLSNVTLSSPSNGQVLKYDSTNNVWVNGTGGTGGTWQGTQAEYDALSTHDPDISYYITDSVSPSLQVSNLTDVSLTSITNGQTLVYQNGTWVNDEAGGKVWQGTQAQYDAITTPDPEVVYYITDSTQGNFALADLTNVSFSQLQGGQVLKYDSTNNIWTNGVAGSGGTWVGTQAQYDAIVTPDPDTTYYITDGVSNGYQLWKGTQAQYDAITTPDDNTIYCITDSEDVTVNLSDLGDTDISSPSAGQIIQYSSSGKWTNGSIDVVIDLSDLGDTNITSPSNGQLLTYSSGEWVNSSLIDDAAQATSTTWSSDKIYNEVKKAYGGTVTGSSGTIIRGQHLYKRDNIIYLDLTINFTTAITDGNRTTIANIPDGFRPPNGTISFVCSGSSNINYYANRMATVLITQGGDILLGDGIWPSGTSVKELSMCISYFL